MKIPKPNNWEEKQWKGEKSRKNYKEENGVKECAK